MEITVLQQLWLGSRGDRTLEDVVVDNDRLGIMMRSNRESVFVELPSDRYIKANYKVVSIFESKYEMSSNSQLVLRGINKKPR